MVIQEIVAAALVLFLASPALAAPAAKTLDIAPVWSPIPSASPLSTRGQQQLMAFYDQERRMTIGSRHLDEDHWQLPGCPRPWAGTAITSGTMALDSAGQIHICGDMHCVP